MPCWSQRGLKDKLINFDPIRAILIHLANVRCEWCPQVSH
jgi:hypothetical protein